MAVVLRRQSDPIIINQSINQSINPTPLDPLLESVSLPGVIQDSICRYQLNKGRSVDLREQRQLGTDLGKEEKSWPTLKLRRNLDPHGDYKGIKI
jgi:hypothetical protein